MYSPGDRIFLVYTDDIFTKLKYGDKGTILYIDDIGNIHIDWDCGEGISMIPDIDIIKKINREEKLKRILK